MAEIQEREEKIADVRTEISKINKQSQELANSISAIDLTFDKGGAAGEDTNKNYNSLVDQQKRINELLGKQALERSRKEEDLENQAVQSRIDAMADGEAKIIAQRELDNKKEIQALKRQKEDYIRAEIEYQKKIFDEQEELNAKRSKDYKKKTFDPSTVKVDTSKFNELISNELIQQSIALIRRKCRPGMSILLSMAISNRRKWLSMRNIIRR